MTDVLWRESWWQYGRNAGVPRLRVYDASLGMTLLFVVMQDDKVCGCTNAVLAALSTM